MTRMIELAGPWWRVCSFSMWIASEMPQLRQVGRLRSLDVYGMNDAIRSLFFSICSDVIGSISYVAVSFASAIPISVLLAGRSYTIHLRIARRRKLHVSRSRITNVCPITRT
uniref:Uncharacterized protein n=1 Tax=Anopheles darlingi TaxID=43151 RepID=A0A2M4DH92_ANODA